MLVDVDLFFSSRRRHTRCALVTGVQTCALPISEGPMRVGTVVLNYLIEGGFNCELWPVNPRYRMLQKRRCFPSIAALPAAPDLAVICTPPAVVPELITALGEIGCRAAVVLTAGL